MPSLDKVIVGVSHKQRQGRSKEVKKGDIIRTAFVFSVYTIQKLIMNGLVNLIM